MIASSLEVSLFVDAWPSAHVIASPDVVSVATTNEVYGTSVAHTSVTISCTEDILSLYLYLAPDLAVCWLPDVIVSLVAIISSYKEELAIMHYHLMLLSLSPSSLLGDQVPHLSVLASVHFIQMLAATNHLQITIVKDCLMPSYSLWECTRWNLYIIK